MTEVPKIVHHRLRAVTPEQEMLAQAHPETDALTAFAEQALTPAERESVLQHLALCADCRGVVALALPPTPVTVAAAEAETETVTAPASSRVRSFAWSNLRWANLRWAALAAGIAIAVLVGRPALEHLSKQQGPVSAVAVPAPAGQPASGSQVAPGSAVGKSTAGKAVEAKAGTVRAKSEFPSNLVSNRATAMPSPQPKLRTQLAGNMKKQSASAGKFASGGAVGAFAFEAPKRPAETVEASGAANVPTTDSTTDSSLMAQAAAPAIVKAKPAPNDLPTAESQKMATTGAALQARTTSQASGALFARRVAAPLPAASQPNANWMITAGALQRSLDGGRTWQNAVQTGHALLCYANPDRSQEVWAGGQAGTLLHSTDGGTNWSTVAVSFKGLPLSADVTHIDARSPSEIILETSNHETWNSADGGKTWEKK